jgi:hypothetical protein
MLQEFGSVGGWKSHDSELAFPDGGLMALSLHSHRSARLFAATTSFGKLIHHLVLSLPFTGRATSRTRLGARLTGWYRVHRKIDAGETQWHCVCG